MYNLPLHRDKKLF